MPMRGDYKTDVHGDRPATLNNRAGAQTDYPTLRTAVTAWAANGLASRKRSAATPEGLTGRPDARFPALWPQRRDQ
jgi:hypothetical protein